MNIGLALTIAAGIVLGGLGLLVLWAAWLLAVSFVQGVFRAIESANTRAELRRRGIDG